MLAAETKNATVKNVHFNGITLNGQSYTGLVGKDQGSTFEQISVQGVDLTANAAYAGVITAQAASSRMSNLLVAETKIHTSANEVGGLVGSADAVTIQKVFADAELHMPYQRKCNFRMCGGWRCVPTRSGKHSLQIDVYEQSG